MANVWKQFKEWGGYDHLNKEGFPSYSLAPEARAYLVTLLPYGDAPTPPEDRNVHYIYGWSDNALKYIAAPDPEVQVEAVRQLELD